MEGHSRSSFEHQVAEDKDKHIKTQAELRTVKKMHTLICIKENPQLWERVL